MDHEEAVKICNLSLQEQVFGDENEAGTTTSSVTLSDSNGFCAICLEKIALPETALVKGCEHAYCVTCILRWATYSQNPSCPQCKLPFDFLSVHRSLDGSLHDYLFEESVCLLLRATWFMPLEVEACEETYEDEDDIYQYYQYEYDHGDGDGDGDLDDLDERYFSSSSNLRIGNRRWGDNGYVRGGRKEARPVHQQNAHDYDAGPSRGPKKDEAVKDTTGRRAKRALKREAADKAAAAKHQNHLVRLGRK